MKHIIYKDFYGYKMTSEANFNASIQNANKITDLKNFSNIPQIIDYFVKYCGSKESDFIIKE